MTPISMTSRPDTSLVVAAAIMAATAVALVALGLGVFVAVLTGPGIDWAAVTTFLVGWIWLGSLRAGLVEGLDARRRR